MPHNIFADDTDMDKYQELPWVFVNKYVEENYNNKENILLKYYVLYVRWMTELFHTHGKQDNKTDIG